MDLVMLALGLALIGFVIWLITTKIPMDPIFRILIYIVVAVALVFWVLRRFGNSVTNVLP